MGVRERGPERNRPARGGSDRGGVFAPPQSSCKFGVNRLGGNVPHCKKRGMLAKGRRFPGIEFSANHVYFANHSCSHFQLSVFARAIQSFPDDSLVWTRMENHQRRDGWGCKG